MRTSRILSLQNAMKLGSEQELALVIKDIPIALKKKLSEQQVVGKPYNLKVQKQALEILSLQKKDSNFYSNEELLEQLGTLKVLKSEFPEQKYTLLVFELFLAAKSKNNIWCEEVIEKLLRLDIRRLAFEDFFIWEKPEEYFKSLAKQLTSIGVHTKLKNMFLLSMKTLVKIEEINIDSVYQNLNELRKQMKRYWGRQFPYFYFHRMNKQFTSEEVIEYMRSLKGNLIKNKDTSIEVLIELLKVFPRDKVIMQSILEKYKKQKKIKKNHYLSFVLLELINNSIFRNLLKNQIPWYSIGRFQLQREVYYQLLHSRKNSLYALIQLWEMGDDNVDNLIFLILKK